MKLLTEPSLAARTFLALARHSAAIPRLRGKDRAFLALWSLLGLRGKTLRVETTLRRPLHYRAELDFQSWLQRLAFIAGHYEPETATLLLQLRGLMGGGRILDIGANIGLLCLPCGKAIGGADSVIAVEAIADNAAALRRNIRLNALQQSIKVIECALGDKESVQAIQVEGNLKTGQGTGTANIVPEGASWDCERISITVRRLDALYAAGEIPPGVRVVKIDVDGYDLKVLQGARHFLATERPIIFGEFSEHCLGWHGQSMADVVSFIAGFDYVVWRKAKGMSFVPGIAGADQDLLLVPRERVPALSGWLDKDL